MIPIGERSVPIDGQTAREAEIAGYQIAVESIPWAIAMATDRGHTACDRVYILGDSANAIDAALSKCRLRASRMVKWDIGRQEADV